MSLCVDAHVHVYEPGFWPAAYWDFAATKASRREQKPYDEVRATIESTHVDEGGRRLLAHMDGSGVDVAVNLTLDWELGIGEHAAVAVDELHRRYGEIARESGGRIVTFAGVDPARPDALGVLTRAREEHGAQGLKLYPPVGFYPYEKIADPLYDACQQWRIPVVFHTGSTVGLLRPRFANPLYVQDVQQRFRDLTIWIAHAGADFWWDEAVAVTRNGMDTYLELSGWQRLVERDEEEFVTRLAQVISMLGAERILFGSDHFAGAAFRPEAPYRDWVRFFEELPRTASRYGATITPAHVDAIMGANAERCLALPDSLKAGERATAPVGGREARWSAPDRKQKSAAEPLTLYEAVYERLKEDILSGRLHGRLRFEELRGKYGASVGPLREAISRLDSEGLVEVERHKWVRVPHISIEDFSDLLAIRTLIEQECIRGAIKQGGDDWLASVLTAFHMYELGIHSHDPAGGGSSRRQRHDEFHNALVTGCGSQRLLWVRGILRSQAERYLNLAFAAFDSQGDHDDQSVGRHRALLDAATHRLPEEAGDLIAEHFRAAAEDVLPTIRAHEEAADER